MLRRIFHCILTIRQERRSCPQCGAKVGPKGSARVIPLFLHNLVATDTGELEALRSTLEEEKRLRKQVTKGKERKEEGEGPRERGRMCSWRPRNTHERD